MTIRPTDVPRPTRLEELHTLRSHIDREISREHAHQERIARLADAVNTALTRATGIAGPILVLVADAFDLTVDDLTGQSRAGDVTPARSVACWLLRLEDMSYPQIGEVMGNRHHTSIMAAVTRVERDGRLLDIAMKLRQRVAPSRKAQLLGRVS